MIRKKNMKKSANRPNIDTVNDFGFQAPCFNIKYTEGHKHTCMHTHVCTYTDINSIQRDWKNPKYHRVKPSFSFYLVSFPDSNI